MCLAAQDDQQAGGIERGTGNVFADLGYPDAEERQTKLRLAYAISGIVREQRLTQAAAAGLLGITPPKALALLNYKLAGFSVERLMTFLTATWRSSSRESRARGRRRRSAWWRGSEAGAGYVRCDGSGTRGKEARR